MEILFVIERGAWSSSRLEYHSNEHSVRTSVRARAMNSIGGLAWLWAVAAAASRCIYTGTPVAVANPETASVTERITGTNA